MGMTGPSGGQSLADWVREVNTPHAFGGGALSPVVAEFSQANYAGNLLVNGSFESWSAGVSGVPDAWTITGAGATLARNTTDFTHGQASVSLSAPLSTDTGLEQAIPISATVNARLRGKTVMARARVKTATAGRAFVRIDDGVGTTDSEMARGLDSFTEVLVARRTLDAAATTLTVSVEISSGAALTVAFDEVMAVEGAAETEFSPHPSDPFFQPRGSLGTGAPTTTSTSLVVIGSGTERLRADNVIVDGLQSVTILATMNARNNTAGQTITFALLRGATQIGPVYQIVADAVDVLEGAALVWIDVKPAAGLYTYEVYWKVNGGTATCENSSFAAGPGPSA